MRTTHPTIVRNSKLAPKILWIENYHPKGSMEAFDIDFIPPTKIGEASEAFAGWSKKIDLCKELGDTLIGCPNIQRAA